MIPQYKARLLCLAQQELSHLSVIFVPCAGGSWGEAGDAMRNHGLLSSQSGWFWRGGVLELEEARNSPPSLRATDLC